MKQAQTLTLVTLAILVAGLIGAVIYVQFGSANATLSIEGQPSSGDPDSPVTVAVFEDFRCPACGSFTSDVYPQIKREYIDTDKIQFVFINFPLPGHGEPAVTAALASECVYQQNPKAFWDYKNLLFRLQQVSLQEGEGIYNARYLSSLASDNLANIDGDALRTCIEDKETLELVEGDIAMARAIGVPSTPSVYINGERVESWNFPSLKAEFDALLP